MPLGFNPGDAQSGVRARTGVSVTIREIAPGDAESAARLSDELGYAASAGAMEQRIRHLAILRDRAVFVACVEASVVGWIDIGIVHHLQVEPYAEIGGLVVASEFRSSGIGRILLARAEQWARERRIPRMVVRSRIGRESAHRFYLREGYERTKTSAVFSKALG